VGNMVISAQLLIVVLLNLTLRTRHGHLTRPIVMPEVNQSKPRIRYHVMHVVVCSRNPFI